MAKAASPMPAPAPQAAQLTVDVVEDDGDWSVLADAQALITAAAAAVAATPELAIGNATAVVALSSDSAVAELNGQYRNKPKPTNVLSFPAPDLPAGAEGDGARFLGDIVLAVETIAREAAEQHTPLPHHLQHLVVHGLLHLLGYDHETPDEAERMESLEIAILARLGIANPYTGELEPDTV